MFVGEGAEAVGFDEEGAAGFDGEGGESGGGAGFEGAGADDGDVEAEVLVGFGNFDRDGLAATHECAAFDCFVGPFESFNGEDGAVADDDSLPDVEAADFFGDAPAEGDVIVGSEKIVEVGGGGEEFDPLFGEGVGHGAEEGFGVTFFELGEKEEGGEVGAQVEEIFRRELAGHDGVAGAGFFGVGEELAELSDAKPTEVIDFGGEGGIGFVLEGGGAEACDTGSAGGGGELERVASVAGDDEKWIGRGCAQRAGLSGGSRITARVFDECSVGSRSGGWGESWF